MSSPVFVFVSETSIVFVVVFVVVVSQAVKESIRAPPRIRLNKTVEKIC
jgi:hypothetical protein